MFCDYNGCSGTSEERKSFLESNLRPTPSRPAMSRSILKPVKQEKDKKIKTWGDFNYTFKLQTQGTETMYQTSKLRKVFAFLFIRLTSLCAQSQAFYTPTPRTATASPWLSSASGSGSKATGPTRFPRLAATSTNFLLRTSTARSRYKRVQSTPRKKLARPGLPLGNLAR